MEQRSIERLLLMSCFSVVPYRSGLALENWTYPLLDGPAITAGGVGKLLSITATPAQNALDRLIDAGILEEVTGQKRNRVYLAREIVRVIDEDRSGR